ncbi:MULTISPECIES: FtsK/SpoIIIE domain-containing protein [unclassified Actinoplanes]|uniref:FtsK/SpoIIIE domain-containing protein n=1 Tax=unclassified Actinoplanes TaxID=2626549 RepID=UPI000694C8A8|nr:MULTISPECIES: FtsK/SpoIIIE domain-containing protein [unclassified Actinoplanes]
MSMFDPLFIGIDEFGEHVTLDIVYHNLLTAGEPGGGKSGLLNLVAATAALSDNTRLIGMDGKWVELGPWEPIMDAFIGDDIDLAIKTVRRLLTVARNRYRWLLANRRRKITREDNLSTIITIIDEIAMFSTVLGTKAQQEEFSTLLRGLVALGRACAMPVVGATQRPSWDIIPASLRDLFGYRCAFRCTTVGSSDVILGSGLAEVGFDASTISPDNPGEALLRAEKKLPYPIKAAWLSDDDIYAIADYAAWLRRPTNPATTTSYTGRTQWEMAA